MNVSWRPFLARRKGYFFIVDAFLAGIILFTAMIMLLARTNALPPTAQTYQVLDSFMQYVSNTQVRDISSATANALFADGNVTSPDFTVAEQVTEMYDRRQTQAGGCNFCLGRAGGLIDSVALGNIPDNYGYSYIVNDTSIFQRYPESRNTSVILASQSIIIFTSKNLTKTIGPYVNRVEVWLR